MPIKSYTPATPPCRLCGSGFEILQPAGAPALETCPKCGGAVALSTAAPVNSPRITKPVSFSEAKSAGFTVLKRTSAGEYEKR